MEWQTRNPLMRALLNEARALAMLSRPVLLVGESGTGKERLARYLHELSGTRGPFLKAEISGPGAREVAASLNADGGTLFLSGVTEQTLHLLRQAPSGVRVIGAAAEVFPFEVNGLARLFVPPMQRRRDDVQHLARELLAEMAPPGVLPSLDAEAMGMLLLHHWPGNVSELKRVLRQAVAEAGPRAAIERRHLPPELQLLLEPGPSRDRFRRYTRGAEILLIRWALAACGDDRTRTAHFLGLSRAALYKKLKQYPELGGDQP